VDRSRSPQDAQDGRPTRSRTCEFYLRMGESTVNLLRLLGQDMVAWETTGALVGGEFLDATPT